MSIVGNFLGSSKFEALVPGRKYGTPFSVRYGTTACAIGVPRSNAIRNALSCSTARRTLASALAGSYPSSYVIQLSWRPLTPPFSSLRYWKYAFTAGGNACPNGALGPVYE